MSAKKSESLPTADEVVSGLYVHPAEPVVVKSVPDSETSAPSTPKASS